MNMFHRVMGNAIAYFLLVLLTLKLVVLILYIVTKSVTLDILGYLPFMKKGSV